MQRPFAGGCVVNMVQLRLWGKASTRLSRASSSAPHTGEGRARAKARGQHMGLTPRQQQEARQRRAEGATLKVLARSYNVNMATISRLRA
jgi:hypothetical protein